MADVVYTHDYKIYVGGLELDGECEFNEDGQVSSLPDEPEALTLRQATRVQALFHELKRIFDEFGTIENIRIKLK